MKKYMKMAVIAACVFLTACGSQKDVIHFQDAPESASTVKMKQSYEVKIQPDDLLGITVNSRNPELVAQFNMPIIGYQVGRSVSADQVNATNTLQGYIVDEEGYINFPVFGRIHVEGMTRTELTKFIEKKLREDTDGEGAYVKDAIVTVKFLNYKISVLGEVNRPGNFTLTTDRITVLEALALAGDLTIYGRRDNIRVIRDVDGQTQILLVNLKSTDLFNQPGYYLQQNDVVYVRPNKVKAQQSGINQNNNVGVWISSASLLATILSLIFK